MTYAYAAVMTASPDSWLLLIVSLPTARATARMRIWRAIKAIGCAALRDGVYLLPARAEHAAQLNDLADETLQEDGQAWVLRLQAGDAAEDAAYRALFDRSPDYAEWLAELSEARKTLPDLPAAERNRLLRRHARAYEAIRKIDFFSNEATVRADAQWRDFAAAVEATHSPGEPRAAAGSIPPPRSHPISGPPVGHPPAPVGGPRCQRLAHPALHRSARPLPVARQPGRLPRRCARLRL